MRSEYFFRVATCSIFKENKEARTALQEEVANTGIVRKNLPFTDDAPQHFKAARQKLAPLQLYALQMPDRQRSTQSIGKASWNQID